MQKAIFYDREFKDEVQRAKQNGTSVAAIVRLRSNIAHPRKTRVARRTLHRVSRQLPADESRSTLLTIVGCIRIECSPRYLEQLMCQPEVEAVLPANIHSDDAIVALAR